MVTHSLGHLVIILNMLTDVTNGRTDNIRIYRSASQTIINSDASKKMSIRVKFEIKIFKADGSKKLQIPILKI